MNRQNSNLLLVWDRIGDYHAARFHALENMAGKGRVFIADLGGADSLYQWKNPLGNHPAYHSLSSLPVEENDLAGRLRHFKKLVRECRISAVGIAGYGRPEYRQMLHWCRLKRIPVILFAESWYPGKADFFKGLYLNFLCHGFLVSGERAKQHFSGRLGLPEHKILPPYSVVDNAHFNTSRPEFSSKKILCVARFSPEKNLKNLLSAFGMSKAAEAGWTLELVGGGPQKQELMQLAPPGVSFRDWVSYVDLPGLYASASAFILPSSFEPWGLVVNEALAAGLPAAVSEECGCAPDLVPDPSFRFPAAGVSQMAEVISRLCAMSQEERMERSEAGREIMKSFSPQAWASAFLQLLA